MSIQDLASLHEELLSATRKLESLIRQPVCDSQAVLQARLAMTTASKLRTDLLEITIYPALLKREPDSSAVRTLREGGFRIRANVSKHIAQWTTERISADWPTYQAAIYRMLPKVHARVAQEWEVLVPLLLSVSASPRERPVKAALA